jgi:hypothetical protein
MDRTATLSPRRAMLARRFECSRLAEEILASVYERLVPWIRRGVHPREVSPPPMKAWRPQLTRRA